MQNFRAKPDTAMAGMADVEAAELAATVAVARLVLGPKMRIQAPPNLIGGEYELLLRAGIDDWGGVSPLTIDHVNPERPWPQLDELAAHTEAAGFAPGRAAADLPRVRTPRRAVAGPAGRRPRRRARRPRHRAGRARRRSRWAGRGRSRRWRWSTPAAPTCTTSIDTVGRTGDRRDDFDSVYGDWDELRAQVTALPTAATGPADRLRPSFATALRHAEADPGGLSDEDALTLLSASPGAEIEALAALADAVRRDAVGDEVTYVVTRNINFTNVCYTGCRFCAFAQRRTDSDAYTLSLDQVGQRADAGVGRRRDRGVHAGRHPPGPAGHGVLRHRRGGEDAARRACTCTRSPRWRS